MEQDQRIKQIHRVTLQGSFINFILTVGKLIAGRCSSTAMIADAIHSLSDLIRMSLSLFIKISKEEDEDHRTGMGSLKLYYDADQFCLDDRWVWHFVYGGG